VQKIQLFFCSEVSEALQAAQHTRTLLGDPETNTQILKAHSN
jgi:hypothetical protein